MKQPYGVIAVLDALPTKLEKSTILQVYWFNKKAIFDHIEANAGYLSWIVWVHQVHGRDFDPVIYFRGVSTGNSYLFK